MKGIPDRYGTGSIPARAIYPSSKANWYIGLLAISKFLRVAGVYLSYDVLKLIHVVQFLFLVKLITAVCLAVIQKPFSSGKAITRDQWTRIIRHAFFSSVLTLLWLFGLTLCGPLRTVFLYEHSDIVIIAGAGALFSGTGGPSKFRGAIFFLVAVIALLLFDNDSYLTAAPTEHPEGKQHHGFNHLFYYLISWAGVSDHKGGVVLLVVTMCLQTGFNSASRKLSVDIGGAKRLNSLSTLTSTTLLAPWALFLQITQEAGVESWLSLVLPFCIIATFLYVMDYYVVAICTLRLEAVQSARASAVAVFAAGLCFAMVWNHPYTTTITNMSKVKDIIAEEHLLSGGVIFSCIMFLFATMILSSPSKAGAKGTFVGYSAAGLPLYTFTGDTLHKTSQSLLMSAGTSLKQILEEPDSRKIFYFLCLNLAFTFVEVVYGFWTNSLGLISDGFHMLFDCSALVMGLYAALMARWRATRTFSFGYGRVEVLSGFMNGLFLVVIAAFIFKEAVIRLFDPPEVFTERLLTVSVAGLIVNLVGISAFHHGHSHSSVESGHNHHSSSSHHHHSHQQRGGSHGHSHAHSNANMQGVFLHILADTMGSVGVIVSSILIEQFGWLVADPICSLFIAIMIFLSVLPLLIESSLVLLLRTPIGMEKEISYALQKVLAVEGILSYRDPHFWRHSANILAGTIHVQTISEISEQKVISQVSAIFRDLGFTHFTVQVEKEEYFHHLTGLSSQAGAMFNTARTVNALNFNDAASTVVKAI